MPLFLKAQHLDRFSKTHSTLNTLRIKAGSIGNLTDARYFAAYGVEWIGFCFDPMSADYIEPAQAAEIKSWLHGPRYVGEFRNQDADNIQAISEFVGLDCLELVLGEIPPNLPPLPLLLRIAGHESDMELSGLPEHTEALVITLDSLTQPETEIRRISAFSPVLLDAEFQAPALPELLVRLQPQGLYLRGGAELQKGFKLFDELDAIFEVLESI
jgi:phosphoribosylanthranilate isomerase